MKKTNEPEYFECPAIEEMQELIKMDLRAINWLFLWAGVLLVLIFAALFAGIYITAISHC